MSSESILNKLMEFGLNKLESEVYLRLLTNPPMTAYRMAKLLDRPAANVYKAFDVLLAKGAVISENDKTKVFRAVPGEEFINMLQSSFNSRAQDCKQLLDGLQQEHFDGKVYQIDSVQLALEKGRRIIENARKVLVADLFPEPLGLLSEYLRAAVERGVQVFLQAYEPVVLQGVKVACPQSAALSLAYWNSQQMNVVADGEEYVQALFDKGMSKVHQATWSQNLYLSVMVHAGLFSEYKLHLLSSMERPEEIREYLDNQKFFYNSGVPGVQQLFNRYRIDQPSQQHPL